LLLVLVRTKRLAGSSIPAVSRLWATVWTIIAINGCIYSALSPIGKRAFPWPGALPWLHLNSADVALFYARESSAIHLFRGLTLFIVLWFEDGHPKVSGDSRLKPEA
jgi:hypothetical protein